jgi:hypothetical protein
MFHLSRIHVRSTRKVFIVYLLQSYSSELFIQIIVMENVIDTVKIFEKSIKQKGEV